MKTLLLASMVAAFACIGSVQAGESKACSSCCAEKSACATAAKAKADLAKARAAASEKGAYLLVKR